jgi:hypothetical protein
VLRTQFGVDDVERLLAARDALDNERQQDAVRLIGRAEERADVARPLEGGAAQVHGTDFGRRGMVPRGEVGLMLAGVGRGQGVIPDPIFSAVIIMSITTTLLAPPVLKWLYRIWPEHGESDSPAARPERAPGTSQPRPDRVRSQRTD